MPITLHHHRLALRLFLILAGFYLLTFHGQTVSRDEQIMLAHSQALLRFSMNFPPVYEATSSEYGVALPLLAAPLSLVDTMIGLKSGHRWPQFALMANALLTALLGFMFYRFLRRLGYAIEDSAFTALLLGLTTQLFPYAGTFFSEPLTALLLFAAFGAAWIGVEERRMSMFTMAGALIGAAALTRFASVIYLPLFVIYAWGGAPSFHGRASIEPLRPLRRMMGLCVPVMVACLIQLVINKASRSAFFDFGYSGSDFTTGYLAGVWGLLFSPGRGLFFYNPLILISLLCAPAFFHRHASAGAFALLFAAITLIFHARFWTWHGGWTPGTRFLLPALPFLFLFAVEGLSRWESRPPLWRIAVGALAALGVVIQFAHVAVNPLDANNELFGLLGRQENPFLFIPQYSSFGGVWTLIADGAWRWRAWSGLGLMPLLIPLLGLVAIAVAGRRVLWPLIRHWAVPSLGDVWNLLRRPATMAAILLLAIIIVVARFGKGERGLNVAVSVTAPEVNVVKFDPNPEFGFARWNLPAVRDVTGAPLIPTIEWDGWLQAPITGTYRFFVKARGAYEVRVGDRILFTNPDPEMQQHLQSAEMPLERGRYYPMLGYFDPHRTEGGTFNVYWTLPGEGIALAHIDREYLLPAPQQPVARFFTKIWRKIWLIILLIVLPVVVFATNPTPLWRQRRGG